MARLWRARLGALAAITGTAREWTVLATELASAVLPSDPARAETLRTLLAQQAERAVTISRHDLLDAAPTTVLASLREAIADWSSTPAPAPALATFATKRLDAAYHRLARRAAVPAPSIGALHRTRIAVKRVHYLTVLFAPVLATPAVRRVKSLRRLQLHLGRMNDAAAARDLLRQTTPPLCGHRLHRLALGRLSRLSRRREAQARQAVARARPRLTP